MMKPVQVVVAVVALFAGLGEACFQERWGSCSTSPNCGGGWFHNGEVKSYGWGGGCGLLWERKHKCCLITPAPTKFPTKKPTRSPTRRPTKFPTRSPTTPKPTRSPTLKPTKSPTTPNPTRSPTPSPTDPTPFPTRAPTTRIPTASPIVPRDLCTETDEAAWKKAALASPRHFDRDIQACGETCAYDVLTSELTITDCVARCMRDDSTTRKPESDPYTRYCALCFGRYTECMVRDCDCPLVRETSDLCVTCSIDKCETDFNACSGRGMSVPVFIAGKVTVELPENVIYIIIGCAGGAVALIVGMSAVIAVRRRRKPTDELAKYAEGIAPTKHDSYSSSNPLFPGNAAAVPVALTAPQFEQLASSGGPRSFVVVHAFTSEFDDELSATAGENVTGVNPVDETGEWWYCKNEAGAEGMIPTVNLGLPSDV